MKKQIRSILGLIIITASCVYIAGAQTSTFTYQGRLSDSSMEANGTYDLRFTVFDAVTGGTQIAPAITRLAVNVANGIFTVQLDFGSVAFRGGNRFLEIAVKGPADANFTTLAPRQAVTSSPYSIRALSAAEADTAVNAQKLGDIAASQFVQTNDTRLTDDRTPTAGSGNYIQNQNAAAQTSANFSISGAGEANIFNSRTQYNIGGTRAFTIIGDNTIAGSLAGESSSGSGNSFYGRTAGRVTTGNNNSIFGSSAGNTNGAGGFNSFFGQLAGSRNTTGNENSFFGRSAGGLNITGINNTALGAGADMTSNGLMFATAIGSNARVANNDTIVLGKTAGSHSGAQRPADAVQIPGTLTVAGIATAVQYNIGANRVLGIPGTDNLVVGKNAGQFLSSVHSGNTFVGTNAGGSQFVTADNSNNSFVGINAGASHRTGGGNTFLGVNTNNASLIPNNSGPSRGTNNTMLGARASAFGEDLDHATAIGADAFVLGSNQIVLGRNNGADSVQIYGTVTLHNSNPLTLSNPQQGGSTHLCLNDLTARIVTICSSSLRFKTNVAPFTSGLNLIKQLKPITFNWKSDGHSDLGFGAEDVAAVDPLLAQYDQKGVVSGVKYDRFSTLFVNAFKEQQTQIERQQKQIDELKQIVCALKPEAAVCRGDK